MKTSIYNLSEGHRVFEYRSAPQERSELLFSVTAETAKLICDIHADYASAPDDIPKELTVKAKPLHIIGEDAHTITYTESSISLHVQVRRLFAKDKEPGQQPENC